MPTHVPVIIDDIFGELVPAKGVERWAVVHTKPRCEKKLAEYARNNGIWYFLPQMESKRIYQKRQVTFTKPMFPGYLFCMLDTSKRQRLTISGLTVGFIRVPVQKELLDDLINIRRSTEPKVAVQPAVWLSSGLRVEITKGPLQGVTGVVENHSKLHELRLQVNILRQAVMVKIDPADVKILGDYVLIEDDQ